MAVCVPSVHGVTYAQHSKIVTKRVCINIKLSYFAIGLQKSQSMRRSGEFAFIGWLEVGGRIERGSRRCNWSQTAADSYGFGWL